MNKLKVFLANNWHTLLAVIALVVVVYLIYRSGKKAGSGNYTVIDDQGHITAPTAEQTQIALSIATRIHDDLSSGYAFGFNFFSSIGRDTDAYTIFAGMSDAMFAYTAQVYHDHFGTSIISDIKDESSLATGGIGSSQSPKDLILEKANRLNIQ